MSSARTELCEMRARLRDAASVASTFSCAAPPDAIAVSRSSRPRLSWSSLRHSDRLAPEVIALQLAQRGKRWSAPT